MDGLSAGQFSFQRFEELLFVVDEARLFDAKTQLDQSGNLVFEPAGLTDRLAKGLLDLLAQLKNAFCLSQRFEMRGHELDQALIEIAMTELNKRHSSVEASGVFQGLFRK